MKQKMITRIKSDLLILLGSCFSAISIRYFLIEHGFLTGGVSGIALIIQYLMNKLGIQIQVVGYLIFIMNIPIFVMGYRFIDREFIYKSMVGTISLALVFLPFFSALPNVIQIRDSMLIVIYAGVLNGLGSGIIMRNRGSLGGTDIIAFILKKYYSINIGTVSFILNVIIVALSSLLFGLEKALYTFIFIFISSSVTDKVLAGIDRRKALYIITDQEEKVAHRIMKEIGRGVTILNAQGGFTHYEKRVLYTIVSIWQLAKVKDIVQEVDPTAFMSVMDTVEVLGKGFNTSKQNKQKK